MDNKYQTSIDFMNQGLGSEIATSLQYMYFHAHCEDMGYEYFSQMFRRISIQEMKHIDEFADRILFLKGDVDMNAAFRTKQVTDVKEMLRLSMQLESKTVDDYNQWSRIAAEHADSGTHRLFQELVVEEEVHLDAFRTELEHMEAYGDRYLALEADAGMREMAATIGLGRDWEK